jgi:hypothetical protein
MNQKSYLNRDSCRNEFEYTEVCRQKDKFHINDFMISHVILDGKELKADFLIMSNIVKN